MNKFTWGNANDPDVNIDYYHQHTLLVVRARLNYAKLARALVSEGEKQKAVKVLDHVMNELPLENVPWGNYMPDIIDSYIEAGAIDKAVELIGQMKEYHSAELDYYTSLPVYYMRNAERDIQMIFNYFQRVAASCRRNGLEEEASSIDVMLREYMGSYYGSTRGEN